jgi:vitamin uptake sensor VUPS-like protein
MPSMFETINLIYLVADAILYFAILSALFRLRVHIGIGAFFCALGVMHFLETYLASVAYVSLPFGIVTSPGSTVLFTGKLMLLLLVYIHEDAVVVRQPIYGLLVGNILVVMMAYMMRNHALMALSPDRVTDLGFLNEMGVLMVWGTGILFIDCILIILLYERSRAWFGNQIFARLALSGAVVLTFDQLAFFAGLHVLTGAGTAVLVGGWIAKMGAVAVYTILVGVYLVYFERRERTGRPARIGDIFDVLTYRERYEDLLAETSKNNASGRPPSPPRAAS